MIKWTKLKDDAYHASVGDYQLYVDKFAHPYWWWKVYYKDTVLNSTQDYTTSKFKAFGLCEGLLRGHEMNLK